MVLRQYKEKFITYELFPSIYTIKVYSEAVYAMGDQDGSLFEGTFGTLRFDEKLSHSLLKFERYWDYKPTNAIHADSPGV